MKVEYLFSRNNSCFSRLIRWAAKFEKLGLDKTPSHMAVLLDEMWVVEARFLSGVRIIPYSKWKKKYEELYKFPCKKPHRDSKEVLEKALKLWGKKYDVKGILYFAWAYLKLILKKEPLPKVNKWQDPNKYFCTEYAGSLLDKDFSMHSPAKICHDWLKEEEK